VIILVICFVVSLVIMSLVSSVILGRNVLGYVSESYGFVNDSWLVSLAIRVVSLVIRGRNVLGSLVVRGRNVFCFSSDFAFRHARIFRMSFVCKLVLARRR